MVKLCTYANRIKHQAMEVTSVDHCCFQFDNRSEEKLSVLSQK